MATTRLGSGGYPIAAIPSAFVPPPNQGNSGKGKGGGNSGGKKQAAAYLISVLHRRKRRKRREFETDATSFIPAQYLSLGSSRTSATDAIDWRRSTRRIAISPSGHTVRKN